MNRRSSLVLAALVAGSVHAETYYWVGGSGSSYGSYAEVGNWRIGSADGEIPASPPGAADTMYGLGSRSINLDGAAYELSGWDSTGDWNRYVYNFTNGTLTVVGEVTTHSDDVHLYAGATLAYCGKCTPAKNDAVAHRIYVHADADLQLLGVYNNYKTELQVLDGGHLLFAPTTFQVQSGSAQNSTYAIAGVMDAPMGVKWTTGGLYNDTNYQQFQLKEGGTLRLGAGFAKTPKGILRFQWSGGTLVATGMVTFVATECLLDAGASVVVEVAGGEGVDLSPFAIGEGVHLTKTGDGALVLGAAAPQTVALLEGSLVVGASTTIETLVAGADTTLKFRSGSLTVGAAELRGSLKAELDAESELAVGDAVIADAPAELLAAVQAALDEAGVSTELDGSSLKLAKSELVFNSTTVTDLNDAAGWKSGSVPDAGMSVVVSGDGVVADVTGAIPAFAAITVEDGATLRVSTTTELPNVTLGARGSLEIAADAVATLGRLSFAAIAERAEQATLRVAAAGTLKVPGGTAFKNCALELRGALTGTSDGPLVFGTAAADETAYFAMTAEGATVTALNEAAVENASRIAFACPDAGGTVVVAGPIVLKDSVFTYNRQDGFAFGLNNPADQAFQVVADNTELDYGADTYVAGGANLVMTNGSLLLRRRHTCGDSSDSKYNLVIQNRGRLTLVDGGELRTGITMVNGNTTDGVVRLNPDEIGWVGLEVLAGGIGSWYKLDGLNRGTLRVADGTVECFTTWWWGWGNREHAFNRLVAAEIPAGSTMTYLGVAPKMAANDSTMSATVFEAPFAGEGDLVVGNSRSGFTLQPTIARGDNTCTGRLSVSADNGTAKARVHFADGANWAGTVVLDGRTDLVPIDYDHAGTAANPAVISVGGAELNEPFVLRAWLTQDGDALTVTNDMINVGAGGWTVGANGVLTLESQSDIVFGDLPELTEFVLGRMPKGGTVPANSSGLFEMLEREIDGDETQSLLVARIKSSQFVFTGAGGTTDLTDPSAWACGRVPTGEDVVIRGEGVTALLDAGQGLPTFASIALRGGATLKVVGKTGDDGDFALPALSCDATSSIVVGDESATATTVLLTGSLATSASVAEDGAVELAALTVNRGATLVVPPATRFKNVELRLYGTIRKDGTLGGYANSTDGEGLCFGYAEDGETAYFAMTADGGRIDIHTDQNETNGRRGFMTPAAGGRVRAVGDLVLRNTSIPDNGWFDYGSVVVGANNPVDEPFNLILDDTFLDIPGPGVFGGAARITLRGKSRIDRAFNCRGLYYGTTFKDSVSVVVEGEAAYVDFNVGAERMWFNGTSARALVLRDGGAYRCRYSDGNGGGTLVASNGFVIAGRSSYGPYCDTNGVDKVEGVARTGVFKGFGAVQVEAGSVLGFVADNSGVGDTKFYRSMTLADIPITGSGDVFVRNDIVNEHSFVVTLTHGANTCTGTIGVTNVVASTNGTVTALAFANGANWAGTVLADENVQLAASEEGTPVSATFGTLHIARDKTFALNAGDTVNLTVGTSGGGTLNVVTAEGEEASQTVELGTAPAGAWAGVRVRLNGRRCQVVETPIEDSELVRCTAWRETGLMLILR
ncbi:MAG: hypothetical protein ACI4RD_01410 [Kiritimatiellia bacterium]